MKYHFDWKIFQHCKEEAPMSREKLADIGVNKLIKELDKCGYDEYYTDYRRNIIREIKRRIRRK